MCAYRHKHIHKDMDMFMCAYRHKHIHKDTCKNLTEAICRERSMQEMNMIKRKQSLCLKRKN